MTPWEKFISNNSRIDLVCNYFKEKSRTGIYTGNNGAGCSKNCPFREYGGHCKLDKMSRESAEKYLDKEMED